MKKKMVGIFVCALLIAATVIPVAGTLISIRDIEIDTSELEEGITQSEGWGWYYPAGAWKRSDNELFLTISPAGIGRYSLTSQGKTMGPTWYGIFPEAVAISDLYGEAVVTGKNTYDFTVVDYAINESYGMVYFRLWSGTMEQTSKDTMEGTFTASIYHPDQDPFGDEEPEYGCWGTWVFTYERIPIVPPCEL